MIMKRLVFFYMLFFALLLASSSALAQTNCDTPVIAPEGQLVLCDDNTITLQTAAGASSYQWYRDGEEIIGAISNTLLAAQEGEYTVKASYDGCEATAEPKRIYRASGSATPSLKIKAEGGYRFCDGQRITLSVEGNFSAYYWSTGERSASIVVDQEGDYSVEAFMGDCSVVGEATVTVLELPSIEIIASDTMFASGQSIELLALGAQELEWFPAEGLNMSNVANPTATPSRTTTYFVTGVSANGCRDTVSVTLHMDIQPKHLSPPKVFSPNNDGTDDYWHIDNIADYPGCEVVVFNRQGMEVFKAQPYENDWDGLYRGSPLPEGDYYYIIQCEGSGKPKTGSVMLVR